MSKLNEADTRYTNRDIHKCMGDAPRAVTDTHYHIDMAQSPGAILEACQELGIQLIAPSMNRASYERIIHLQKLYSAIRLVGLGLHPESSYDRKQVESVIAMAATADVLGEVGLPCYERTCTEEDLDIFRTLCKVAALHNKPMIVHAVHDQARPALNILSEEGVRRAVFHWLKADDNTVREIVEHGYFVSVTPEVTYRERDQHLFELVPPNRLLIETDGPYPHGGPYEGKETKPQWIQDVAEYVALGWHCRLEDVWQQHERNVSKCFYET